MTDKLNGLSPNAHKVLTNALRNYMTSLYGQEQTAIAGGNAMALRQIAHDREDANYLLGQLRAMDIEGNALR